MPTAQLLPESWTVPESFRKRLGTHVGRQRLMHSDDHLLLVLHAPPSAEDDERQGRFFWRDPSGEWRSSDHGAGVAALRVHIDEYLKDRR